MEEVFWIDFALTVFKRSVFSPTVKPPLGQQVCLTRALELPAVIRLVVLVLRLVQRLLKVLEVTPALVVVVLSSRRVVDFRS